MLDYAARGFANNSSATDTAVLTFIYQQLRDGHKREATAKSVIEASSGLASSNATSKIAPVTPEDRQEQQGLLHEALITEFALTMLSQRLRKGGLATLSPEETLNHLDPLLPLLVLHLGSRDTGCVTLALKCLSQMVHLPLPSLKQTAPEAGTLSLSRQTLVLST